MTTEAAPGRLRAPAYGTLVGSLVVACGFLLGSRPLSDNSFLTHLATGRLILDSGSIPTHDPYSFTATGEPWVVQSWLASVLFAVSEELAGPLGIRLLFAFVGAALAFVAWRLLRPVEGVIARLAVAALFVSVAAQLWSERPFLFGLLALGLYLLAAEGQLDPRWLIPAGWLWVNTHGSFPLGIVALAVAALGRRLDGDDWTTERRALLWGGGGILLGALNPLGPRLLLFPAELLSRQDLLAEVIEWRAPTFTSASQRLFLLELLLAVVLIARRPSYRSALLTGVFVVAALLGARNLAVASLVLLVPIARGVGSLGTLRWEQRPQRGRALLAGAAAVCLLVGASRLGEEDYRFGGYPADALAVVHQAGIDLTERHLVLQDSTGNLLTLLYGDTPVVFFDDRFDMFPTDVFEDHLAVTRATPGWRDAVDRWDIELAVFDAEQPIVGLLGASGWRIIYVDDDWALLCRRGAALGELGRC